MERGGHVKEISPSDKTIPNDPERTVVAPRFDQKSIQSARPAVPLAAKTARRTGPLTFVVLCVVAGLAGGLLGGLALAYYQNKARPRASAEATLPPSAGTSSGQTGDAPTAPDTAAQNTQAGTAEGQGAAATATQPEASRAAAATQAAPPTDVESGTPPDAETQTSLRGALGEWVAATNARDIPKQMSFYNPTLNAFYRSRNASREAVRAEKQRVLGGVEAVDIRAGEPDIRLSRDGRTATMRFRKKYSMAGGGKERRGEVLQELRWQRTEGGWKIVSERDLRVIQ